MQKNRFHALLLGTLLLTGASAAQEAFPLRGPAYFEHAAELAGVLGAAHAIRVRCNGVKDQYWRRYMADLLSYEAPERGPTRESLVSSFNSAYSRASSQYDRCNQSAVEAEGHYARQGRDLANRLSTHYFPKRSRRTSEE
jgi:uncharacterized protein (TIGR02301 family)